MFGGVTPTDLFKNSPKLAPATKHSDPLAQTPAVDVVDDVKPETRDEQTSVASKQTEASPAVTEKPSPTTKRNVSVLQVQSQNFILN